MKIIALVLISLSLSSCASIQHPRLQQCEKRENVAISMFGGGWLVAVSGFLYGVLGNDELGFSVFTGGWVVGMSGVGLSKINEDCFRNYWREHDKKKW